MKHAFYPGQIWLDTEGKRIQAHGGSVFYENGVYYWYGENKEFTDPDQKIWHWGVRCYRSRDLYNWEDLGIIIPPEPEDPKSSLHPAACMDRPHIIFNEKTKKYVCWLKVMNLDGSQTETVLTADGILGPYTKVREGLRPLGMDAGDFDLAVAPDGKAYYYFEKVHSETVCAELTEDYTDVSGVYSTHFPRKCPPFVREATAHFVRGGRHYLLTSGTTGYLPNPSEVAVSDDWHGPFRVLGDPHRNDHSQTSFHSQISSVFRVQEKKICISPALTAGCPMPWSWNMGNMPEPMRRCSAASRSSGRLSGRSIPGRTPPRLIMCGCRCDLKRIWYISIGGTAGLWTNLHKALPLRSRGNSFYFAEIYVAKGKKNS